MNFDLTKYQVKKSGIIDATYRSILELGVAKVSMRSIAREAQVNQPTLHYYFKTRENLLSELIRALFERFIFDITRTIKPLDPPAKKLDALLDSLRTHIVQEKDMMVVFVEVWSLAIRNPAMQEIFANLYKGLYAVIDAILEEGIKKGVFHDHGRTVVPVFLMIFVEGLGLLWHMREHCFDKAEQFDLFVKALRRLLAGELLPKHEHKAEVKLSSPPVRESDEKKALARLKIARGDTRRAAIINGTFRCLYEMGAEEVSMRLIAKEAQVNQSVVHYYFQNKENLLLECLEVLFEKFIYDIERQYQESDPPEKKFNAIFHSGKTFVGKQKELFVVFMHCWALSMRSPLLHKKFSALYDKISAFIENTLSEGYRKGVFNKVNVRALSNYIIAFVEGIGSQWLMTGGAFDLDEFFDFFITDCKHLIIKHP